MFDCFDYVPCSIEKIKQLRNNRVPGEVMIKMPKQDILKNGTIAFDCDDQIFLLERGCNLMKITNQHVVYVQKTYMNE